MLIESSRTRKKKCWNNKTGFRFFIMFSVACLFLIGLYWEHNEVLLDIEGSHLISSAEIDGARHEILHMKKRKPAKREVKGIYLTAYSAGNPAKVQQMIDLINTTELNAVVIDIKDYSGLVLYDSGVELTNELDLEDDRLGDVPEIIQAFHDHDIYVIARQTVFQDPILAVKKPEWAIASKAGGLWRDHKGLAWVDPTKKEVWNYNVEIAREAIGFGFDEINFDYVRFPSDGNMSMVVYTNGDKSREEIMGDFYHYLNTELGGEPAYISLDMFGFVMERHDGMSIGQRLEDAVDEVDYVCPMMYPSHYPPGHLNLVNPAAYPGLVIENGMKKGQPYFENKKAKSRPWIQAFNLGATYGAENIRAQIDMVEKYTDGGWLLWNAANRYGEAGLKQVSSTIEAE
ncbi:MAG: putative glycoside hydrolase [Candidatus Magasanikbacteria bacterium]